MFRQMVEDHFILYLMLMATLGALLGFVGTLLIYIVLSWHHVVVFLYSVFEQGWG